MGDSGARLSPSYLYTVTSPRPNPLVLFLHAHLPFVRHPEHEDFLEEDWLFEAITEVYLPLIRVARGWVKDELRGRLGVSLSPSLLSMLQDDLLMRRYRTRLFRLIDLMAQHLRTSAPDSGLRGACAFQLSHLEGLADLFEVELGRNVVGALDTLETQGALELATCVATHAFLPLYAVQQEHAGPHIRVAVRKHRETFGRNPPGVWLPECGYVPGLDRQLAEAGLCYFFVDTHALAFANPPPQLGPHAPIVCDSGVLAFARDPEASFAVWSAAEGYPGDPRYREFHRDLGFDLDAEALQGLILGGGQRRHLGLKCHRVTGRHVELGDKEPYDRQAALHAVDEHARHFVQSRLRQGQRIAANHNRPAIMSAPFDAELFGHWWFEGPEFLDRVIREVEQTPGIEALSPGQVIAQHGPFELSTPAASSWGDRGYAEVWLNEKNDWIWPHLHHAAAQMSALVAQHGAATGLMQRALQQLGRELLLAAASDWPFMITMGTTVAYAERRVRDHVQRFNQLSAQIEAGVIDEDYLQDLEAKDNLLPHIDLSDFVNS